MKFKLLIIITMLFVAGIAQARVKNIADWTGATPSGANTPDAQCSTGCNGPHNAYNYTKDLSSCSDKYRLVSCSVPGCGHYRACLKNTVQY